MNIYKNGSIITLFINKQYYDVVANPKDTLVTVLRRELSLTGSKPGCEQGNCGTCTILLDGIPMKSCLMLALEAVGHEITTIEGLENTVIQEAFIKHLAFQCGYCTSGFIMNIAGLLTKYENPNEKQIKEWMESNICRCTSYEEISKAIADSILNNKV